jgi:hypothetical protein
VLAAAQGTVQGFAWLTGIAALGPQDAWASITTDQSKFVTFLEHWDGTAWHRVKIPVAAGISTATPVVSDGHGGLWLALKGAASPGSRLLAGHYSGGHWTVTKMPTAGSDPDGDDDVSQLAWIPGTRSLWATEDVFTANLGPAVLKYGP